MHPYFEVLTPRWFKRAFVYTGSIGEFGIGSPTTRRTISIHAAVYTHFCYEAARMCRKRIFPGTMRAWSS